MLHKLVNREENGFMDRWEYLQWRAVLAGIKAKDETSMVTFQAKDEDAVAFARLTGFLSAVQWLQNRGVILPGIEDYPRGEGDWPENDYRYQADVVE